MILKSEDIFLALESDSIYGNLKKFAVDGYHIDSRYITKNSVFFAFEGENSDGHEYIASAITHGATLIIARYLPQDLENKTIGMKFCIILVDDVLVALHKMAILARSKTTAKCICLTGSIGKTTTKEMLSFVLSNFFNTSASFGNKNNHLGLPLSILNTDSNANLMILELGMNHLGEISELSKIARPDISIITTIAPTHIANFKDLNEVAEAKAEIFHGMSSSGIVVLNQDNQYFNFLVKKAQENGLKTIIGVGKKDVSPIFIDNYKVEFGQSNFDLMCNTSQEKECIHVKTLSISYNIAFNSVFLFAIAKLLKLNLSEVSGFVTKFKGVDGRGNIEHLRSGGKDITIINDCYNASPDSVKSSILTLVALKQENKNSRALCVFGDMLELGKFSQQYHEEIGHFMSSISEIDEIHCIGNEIKYTYDVLLDEKKGQYYGDADLFKDFIKNNLKDGDILLIKGSRGMKLERVIDFLYRNS